MILDESGKIVRDADAVCERWCRHFTGVLNIESTFNPDVVEQMEQLAEKPDLNQERTLDELTRALKSLCSGKAGSSSGILPEMLVHGGSGLKMELLALVQSIWREGEVVAEWRDAVVVPVPKKRDLMKCDH